MARTKRIKYKNYPYTLATRMKVDKPIRVCCQDGAMKAHVRRKTNIVLHFYFQTLEKRDSFVKKTKDKLRQMGKL